MNKDFKMDLNPTGFSQPLAFDTFLYAALDTEAARGKRSFHKK